MAIASNQKKKAILALERENELNKGILNFGTLPIENYFDPNEQISNCIITGSNNAIRTKAAVAAAVNAYNKGRPVIIIHESNSLLEHNLQNSFGATGMIAFINKSNPAFDPFFNLENHEISGLIINSFTGKQTIDHVGRYYIEGIAEFYRAHKFDPLCIHYIKWPYNKIFDIIDDQVSRNILSFDAGHNIKSKLMQGQTEISKIDSFFQSLKAEISGILASGTINRKYKYRPVNILSVGSNLGVLSIDILSNLNHFTVNILVGQIGLFISTGKNPLIIIDSLSVSGSDLLSKLLMIKSVKYHVLVSTDDIYAMVGSDDNIFNTLVSNSGKLFIGSHNCSKVCDKLAETLGSFDKKVLSHSYGNDMANVNISTQKDYRVQPSEINSMEKDEFYVYDNSLGKLTYAKLQ